MRQAPVPETGKGHRPTSSPRPSSPRTASSRVPMRPALGIAVAVLRWGILGPGRIAPRLVRGLAQTERGDLVAVASRDLGRAREFAARHGIGAAFGSYQALLDADDVDVVYISLPNHLHAEWTMRALDAGKHVLCEKPLALSAGDVDRIIAASERSGHVAMEAFMYRHHPQIIRGARSRPAGRPGALELVNGSFSFFLDPSQRSAHRPGDGWRLALGRRVLPGQPGALGRGRGARCPVRLRPLR